MYVLKKFQILETKIVFPYIIREKLRRIPHASIFVQPTKLFNNKLPRLKLNFLYFFKTFNVFDNIIGTTAER